MSKSGKLVAALSALLLVVLVAPSSAEEPVRLLREPTLSAESIAFRFAGDLWSVPRAGGAARRLTASVGRELDPQFSPDGRSVAFTGEYDGNLDVYVMPAGGGEPLRLTYHPGEDRAVGWTRDGKSVLFRSYRDNGVNDERLWTVPAVGGWPKRLPLPEAYTGSFSPDGKRLAYMPHQRFQLAWKRYRGGEATFVWIVDLDSLELHPVPRERSNDSYPTWAEDGRVYFLSDRDGTVTLYRHDPATDAVERVFANDGLDLKFAQAGPGAVVFERFGEIGLFDLASGAVSFPEISIASELEATRARYEKVGDQVQAAAISPTGARAVVSARGEIFTVPAEKGDARNITRSSRGADRDPAWSPDGKTLAWTSDATGEAALHLAPADGLAEARALAPPEPAFLYRPVWSPDGKRIALTDQALRLWIVDVASGQWTKVDTDTYDHPARTLDPAWSPDSRWLAYSKRGTTQIHSIWLHELASGRTRPLTDGLADAVLPVFDASGKYLWLAASTDFGPTAPWLDMTSVEHPVSRSLWLALLAADTESPFPPESDEEKGEAAVDDEKGGEAKGTKTAKGAAGKKADEEPDKSAAPPATRVDFDGIARRLVAAPGIEAAYWQALAPGKAGELVLLAAPELVDPDAEDDLGAGELWHYSIEKREAKKLADKIAEVHVSADGEKMLVRAGDDWSIVPAGEAIEAGKGEIAVGALETLVAPRAEWHQIYHEAWRLERDFFYDPNHHGLDLEAAERRYERYLDGLADRDDLNYLLTEALGELSVGHMYVGGGDGAKAKEVPGGLLGADWTIENGRYRVARIYSGESWNPELEAPLDKPEVGAKVGDYLIAVEGRVVAPPDSIYAAFEATAGKRVRIRLAADPAGKGARDATVIPIANERRLRYRAWVEENRRTVERLSEGRIGYFHLPNTAGAGYESFNRYFFPQIDKQALLVDERYNGGGLIADYFVELLAREPMWGVAARAGTDMVSPAGALYGPKAMLINRHAGSGGDALPWMFRYKGLGPLVGTRTWGGLVGIWDYPERSTAGRVTAPRGGLYTINGKWEVENLGVDPRLRDRDHAARLPRRPRPAAREGGRAAARGARAGPTGVTGSSTLPRLPDHALALRSATVKAIRVHVDRRARSVLVLDEIPEPRAGAG